MKNPLNDWKQIPFQEFAALNPRESLQKGQVAKHVGMENIQPFTRKVPVYSEKAFGGGSKFVNGDTLLARITPCLENGKTAQVDFLMSGEVGFGSTEFIVLREKQNVSDNNFLFYFSISPRFRSEAIKSMSGTSGRQRVQTDSIAKTEFAFPALKEQKAIAAVLSSLDDKIELLREQNKSIEAIAQVLFKRWFVDFEFPNEKGKPYKSSGGKMVDSELGEIPEGWNIETVGNVTVAVTKGTTPTTIDGRFADFGINFIKAESINDQNGFDIAKFSHIDDRTNTLLKRSTVLDNDLLFTIAGTIGRFAIVTSDLLPANTNQAVAIIRVNREKLDPYYLNCAFKLKRTKEELFGNVVEAVQANLSLTSIKECRFVLPSDAGKKLFIAHIKPLYTKKNANVLQTQTLSRLRDTLLPKLMKGEIRVN